MTMAAAPVQIDRSKREPPVPDGPAPSDTDIVLESGLESFPASDPPSWWAGAGR